MDAYLFDSIVLYKEAVEITLWFFFFFFFFFSVVICNFQHKTLCVIQFSNTNLKEKKINQFFVLPEQNKNCPTVIYNGRSSTDFV